MKKNSTLTSAVGPLKPHAIWDTKTGEQVPPHILEANIEALCSFVQTETKRLFENDPEQVIGTAANLKGSANSYGRQQGYASAYKTLPREVLAKSRLNELVLYKLMSETASYAKNPNPTKQYPTFPKTVNLGAINKQMASLSRDGNTLTLLWKCWTGEYLIDFIIPDYVVKRNIAKYSLPLIRWTAKGYDFIFSVQEAIPTLAPSALSAGVDLGRVEPYTLAVTNQKGSRVAHYTATGRLSQLARQREDILNHKRNILVKSKQYEALGLSTETLMTEKDRLATKAKVMGKVLAQQVGAEIAKKLRNHALNTLNVENLAWVHGAKYGSKWNHSVQQEAITHTVTRSGIRVRKVNPKNSSQLCHGCGTVLTHSGRRVRCATCQSNLDRDYNAAMNIATQYHLEKHYPSLVINGLAGDNCSPIGQVIGYSGHSSKHKTDILQRF